MDFTKNNHITSALADYIDAKRKLAHYKKVEEASKAILINAFDEVEGDFYLCGSYEVRKKHIKGSEGKMITIDDVGTYINKRSGSTSINVVEVFNG